MKQLASVKRPLKARYFASFRSVVRDRVAEGLALERPWFNRERFQDSHASSGMALNRLSVTWGKLWRTPQPSPNDVAFLFKFRPV